MNPELGELLVHQVAPRIRSVLPSFTSIGSEEPEEQAQDAIALAAKLLVSTQARRKKVTPGNIAYYAVRLVRQGRRSTGLSTTDAMHPATQLKGRSRWYRWMNLAAPMLRATAPGACMSVWPPTPKTRRWLPFATWTGNSC